MFKGTKHPDFIVSHRLGGNHASRDPLMDEKIGASRRSRESDGSHVVEYKESAEERKARLRKEKEAEKAAKKSKSGGLAALQKAAEEAEKKAKEAAAAKAAKSQAAQSAEYRQHTENKLKDFKDRLKSSNISDAAAAAEAKHKADIAREEAEALEKYGHKASESSSSSRKRSAPDDDERLSMNEILNRAEGEEGDDNDWLGGKGLKFHTTADKAFSMDQKKFKETVQSKDGEAKNRELLADQAKKKAELRMAEFRRTGK
eukprot:TRINITY_DN2815_c1_g3_i4.p1 TRINITY_DN2815_c1_g3~~TRINITY_DN2815_c1_g3_i4.p1  ORF type:complete len:259 (-),score=86.41 TRINITY_DN2815_c1_g3_i4:113-889(-)